MARLTGKAAVVSGAASGIGAATARALAAEGARVLAVDVDEDGLTRLAGGRTDHLSTQRCDITRVEDICAAITRAEALFGGLDILCNCAGVAEESPFLALTADNWNHTIDVNLRGVFRFCQNAIPIMRRSDASSIVNIGSIAAIVGETGFAAYCASKGGVLALTKAIAVEHAGDGVRVNCLCPGMVDTPMARPYIEREGEYADYLESIREWQPLGLGRPEQIAAVAVFLASDDASFITGSAVMADGGFTAL